ncbi:MAG TPA: malto-oligosyltrehalose synthase, partial [Alphaproteobacteria bacterium]|nr:malto-oligosyltrehalose synthase [Alphaproteobacteria bacterium]
YVDETGASGADRRSLGAAIAAARRAEPGLPAAVFAAIGSVLCRPSPGEALLVARHFQQLTGPVVAKGLEDRALYRANRLIALNDVGARPDRFALSVASFHDFNRQRQRRHPHGMLAGSTHDSKRGEDARALVVALSCFGDDWAEQVRRWRALLRAAGAPEIDANDTWYFFQALLGAWPMALGPDDALDGGTLMALRDRLEAATLKAVREAAVHTSWVAPNADYEAAIRGLIATTLATDRDNPFLKSFRAFAARIGWAGAQNALVATALKLTAPGVPDIYQGAEFWEQSMVDPDNRRPVDFAARRETLAGLGGATVAELAASWRDGRVKLALTATLLRLRRRAPRLFAEGSYEPVAVTGPDRHRVCAFIRRLESQAVLVAVRLWPGRSDAVAASFALEDGAWFELLERRQWAGSRTLTAAELLARLPVAVLTRIGDGREDADMDLTWIKYPWPP